MKGANDFDFLIGDWRVHHRRLKERLANNQEWVEFDGTCASRKILGGLGNMDENLLDMPVFCGIISKEEEELTVTPGRKSAAHQSHWSLTTAVSDRISKSEI
jgi:hypothetical protein